MKIFNPTVSGSIILPTGSAPVTSSGFAYIYAKTDGKIYLTQEDGTEAEVGGGGGGGGFTFYDVTLADAENTTTATNVFTATVPANTWLDGQAIIADFAFDWQNTSGGTVTTAVTFSGTGITGVSNNGSVSDGSTDERGWVRFTMIRNGAGVYTYGKVGTSTGNWIFPTDLVGILYAGFTFGSASFPNDASVDFTTNIDITLNFKWNTADPGTWIRPFWGAMYKTEKGGVS